ncbi:aminoglycoside phosphotransferase family protein [Methylopila henanensis]|uniref:Aminoglycoside phosphotransferase family protein n=1 Tax=Methylopila henanensis TaxID=873516 RepID=A0ABW4K4L9_9HYPH
MSREPRHDFEPWLTVWRLAPDGEPIVTPSSRLLPVRSSAGADLMLKIATAHEERSGAAFMVWRAGEGAAGVMAHEGDALLMARATGPRSLKRMAETGDDDEATLVLCGVVAALHGPRLAPPAALVPLARWFDSLLAAGGHGGLVARCAATAHELLDAPSEVVPLHGDIHHGNVLDFGRDGWLAIDPKGLMGERAFDYANLFCNPTVDLAREPNVLARRLKIVSAAASLDPERLLKWVLAWAALSAIWNVEDGKTTDPDLTIAEIAAAELDRRL